VPPGENNRVEAFLARRGVTAAVLAVMLLLAWIYYAIESLQARNFIIMTDELQYVKLAINALSSPIPELRGEYLGSYNQLYPWLLAPFAAVFGSMPKFYLAMHIVSPLMMVSVLIPTYLLARSVGASRVGSLCAAALAVAGPWLGFSTLLMTENVAYPAFVWALLGMQRTLAEPSGRNDLIALLGIAFAVFARTQLVVLAVVLPIAALLIGGFAETARVSAEARITVFKRGVADAVRAHFLLFAVIGAAIVFALILAVVGSTFGIYDTVFRESLFPQGAVVLAGRHLGTMIVGMGILPFLGAAAFVIAALHGERFDHRARAFAVLALVSVAAVIYQSSAFDINFAAGAMNDRYAFYIIPVIAIALVLAIELRRPGLKDLVLAGAFTALLVNNGYYAGYGERAWVGAPSSAIDPVLNGRFVQWLDNGPGSLTVNHGLVLLTLVAVVFLAFCLNRRSRGLVVIALVAPALAWNVASARYMFDHQIPFSPPTLAGIKASLKIDTVGYASSATVPPEQAGPVDWVDRVLKDDTASLLPSESIPQEGWWQDEYWNRRVERVMRYVNPAQTPEYRTSLFQKQLDTLHHDAFTIDPATGAVSGIGPDKSSPYLVIADHDARFSFAGEQTLRKHPDWRAGLPTYKRLVKVNIPYRARWLLTDALDDGHLVGQGSTLRFFPSKAQKLRVTIELTRIPTSINRTSWSVSGRRPAKGSVDAGHQNVRVVRIVCVVPDRPTELKIAAIARPKSPDGKLTGLAVSRISTTPVSAGACDA
jgi:hypothetical protein